MKTKTVKITLEGFGSYLGMERGSFVVKNRHDEMKRYPLFENQIAEIKIKSGNLVSSGALACCGFWGIDFIILTQKGNPVAVLRSLEDDSHVKTRICQYEALNNDKGLEIAEQIVLAKLEGQNQVLKKYGLKSLDTFRYLRDVKALNGDLKLVRTRLMNVEGHFSRQYFSQVFGLFNESLRPVRRRTFKAYDGLNNIFNLAYRVLSWKVHRAIIRAKLEPYLGFLHSEAWGKPSLVCDFMELYRYIVEGFLIENSASFQQEAFIRKREDYSKNKIGQREYLNDNATGDLTRNLYNLFESTVEVDRIRHGKRQTIETLINEEALLLAQYLRDESQTWNPRILLL